MQGWRSKLVRICADGAAVNMGMRSGAARRMQEEWTLETLSTEVHYFKSTEDTSIELYKPLQVSSVLEWITANWPGTTDASALSPQSLLEPGGQLTEMVHSKSC